MNWKILNGNYPKLAKIQLRFQLEESKKKNQMINKILLKVNWR